MQAQGYRPPGLGQALGMGDVRHLCLMGKHLRAEPVKLPSPDLPDEPSQVVATAALDALEAHDVMGGAPRELEHQAENLGEQVQRLVQKSGSGRCLFGAQPGGRTLPER